MCIRDRYRGDYIGGYWSTRPPPYAFASFYLDVPEGDFHYWEWWVPAIGTCVNFTTGTYSSPWADTDVYSFDDTTLDLYDDAGDSIRLTFDTYSWRYEAELTDTDFYVPDQSYRLGNMDDAGAPALSIEDFFETPSGLTVTRPTLEGSVPPTINRRQTFEWASDGSRAVRINLQLLDASFSTTEEEVECWVEDDGRFTVPPDVWSAWPIGRQVMVSMSSVSESTGTLWYNRANIRTLGITASIGAGFSG